MQRSRRIRLRLAAGRFARAERGATAVEFALILLPFSALMFGIFELAALFLVTTNLESATEIVARTIRTGEFQKSGAATKAAFKTAVCERMAWQPGSCASDLIVETQTFASFASLASNQVRPATTFANPVGPTRFLGPAADPATCWSPGKPTDIVLVRTYYKWRLFTPGLNQVLENMTDGSGARLITTATAFRNEPYSEETPVGSKC